jgi:hypothetical protein
MNKEVNVKEAKGKVINFPKRGNAELNLEAEFKYEETDPEKVYRSIQVSRIRQSLDRINELMKSLKEATDAKQK